MSRVNVNNLKHLLHTEYYTSPQTTVMFKVILFTNVESRSFLTDSQQTRVGIQETFLQKNPFFARNESN